MFSDLTEDTTVVTQDPFVGTGETTSDLTEETTTATTEDDLLVGSEAVEETSGGSGGMLSDSGGQGYMGGFNYNLPQFVPVAYQPKDYDVELNRIIKQSLFQGMV